jgi:hypothetical protein
MRALYASAYRFLSRRLALRHPFSTGALAALLLFPGFAGTGSSLAELFLRLAFFSVSLGLFCWIVARLSRSGETRWGRALRFHLPILALIPVVAIPADAFPPLRPLLAFLLCATYLWFSTRSAWRRSPRLRDSLPWVKRLALLFVALGLTGVGAVLLIGLS